MGIGWGLGIVIFQLIRMNLSIRVTAQAAVYQQACDARSLLVRYPELLGRCVIE